MPLVFVHRGSVVQLIDGGTQVIESGGTFNLQGYVEFELDPTVFNQPGRYILVDYSAGSFTYPTPTYGSGQAALDALATVNTTALVGLTAGPLIDDVVNERITVTLSPS